MYVPIVTDRQPSTVQEHTGGILYIGCAAAADTTLDLLLDLPGPTFSSPDSSPASSSDNNNTITPDPDSPAAQTQIRLSTDGIGKTRV